MCTVQIKDRTEYVICSERCRISGSCPGPTEDQDKACPAYAYAKIRFASYSSQAPPTLVHFSFPH
jgi:hypothetical protein